MQQKNIRQSLRAAELIKKYLDGSITEAEQAELEQWIRTTDGSSQLLQEVTNPTQMQQGIDEIRQHNTEEKWGQLLDRIIASEKTSKKRLQKFTWMHAAAVLLVTICFWTVLSTGVPVKTEAPPLVSEKYGNDVAPGKKKAELILSDGSIVLLDASLDSSFRDAGANILLNENGIQYRPGSDSYGVWNTVRTPNGGEYHITLSDGTKVWLNAASSLVYPVQFNEDKRTVEITGEAYFEVAPLTSKARGTRIPFTVSVNGVSVEVLGTHFNVNAYPTEKAVRTTLVEGSVKVTRDNASFLIKPGEQAELPASGSSGKVRQVDTEPIIAWTNGLFLFNNTPLQEVLNQVSRWYDVTIIYQNGFQPDKFFTAEIGRDMPVSKLLERVELTGIARFRISGNTIIVSPYKQVAATE